MSADLLRRAATEIRRRSARDLGPPAQGIEEAAIADLFDAEADRVEKDNAHLIRMFGEQGEIFYTAPSVEFLDAARALLREPS